MQIRIFPLYQIEIFPLYQIEIFPLYQINTVPQNTLRDTGALQIYLYIFLPFQVIYCSIPKTGCTNWKKTLVRSNTGKQVERKNVHKENFMNSYGLIRLNTFSPREISKRLKTYFKFLVVRHPLERLLSAFRSKFGSPDKTDSFFARYLPHIRNHGKRNDADVSFTNFISYALFMYKITAQFYDKPLHTDVLPNAPINYEQGLKKRIDQSNLLPKGSMYLNEHWAQYSTICHPCHIDYDYIVKFETMRKDAAYVLSKLGPHHQCLEKKYPELFNVTESSSSLFDSYFSTLEPDQIKELKKMYSVDFKLFGYKE